MKMVVLMNHEMSGEQIMQQKEFRGCWNKFENFSCTEKVLLGRIYDCYKIS